VNKTLKTIEEELTWLIKDYKATTDYKPSKLIETLNYNILYEKKNIKLTFQFLLMPKQDSVTLKFIYLIRDNEKEYHTIEYPLSKIRTGLELPMINEYDYQRIYDIMDFEVENEKIKSTVSQLTQGLTFTEVIRRNIKEIIKQGRDLRKKYV